MPLEQRGWGHQPEPAQFLRQHTPEGGEHRPIRPGQSRARNLTAKDSDLMAQHQDLCLLPALRPAQQHEPTEQPIHDQLQQASRHEGSSSSTRRSTKREATASFALSGTAHVYEPTELHQARQLTVESCRSTEPPTGSSESPPHSSAGVASTGLRSESARRPRAVGGDLGCGRPSRKAWIADSEPFRTPVPIESVHRFRRFRTPGEELATHAGVR